MIYLIIEFSGNITEIGIKASVTTPSGPGQSPQQPSTLLLSAHGAIVNNLLNHIMKILNIFHHVIMNIRPVFIPQGQKNDNIFFTGSKEFLTFNTFGYFGNDYFYLKIYNLIRISYNSYKVRLHFIHKFTFN